MFTVVTCNHNIGCGSGQNPVKRLEFCNVFAPLTRRGCCYWFRDIRSGFGLFRLMSETTTVHVRVLAVTPVTVKSKLLALASAEIIVAGVAFTLHGIQVIRTKDPGTGAEATGAEATGVDVPRYRAPDGIWRQAVELPPELQKPLAHAILDECCDLGITRRRHSILRFPKVYTL